MRKISIPTLGCLNLKNSMLYFKNIFIFLRKVSKNKGKTFPWPLFIGFKTTICAALSIFLVEFTVQVCPRQCSASLNFGLHCSVMLFLFCCVPGTALIL
jgi:hypothetical protein